MAHYMLLYTIEQSCSESAKAYHTHGWLLGPLLHQFSLSVQLCVKKFEYQMMSSTNNVVGFMQSKINLSDLALLSSCSPKLSR